MSEKDVERIRKNHEDAMVREVLIAVPTVHEEEIRRLVKEHGDTNKIVDLLTEDPIPDPDPTDLTSDPPQSSPTTLPEAPINPPVDDVPDLDLSLTKSLEELTLTRPFPDDDSRPPSQSNGVDLKSRARQRRQVSVARKQKQAKRAQKDAAKRRRRMESEAGAKEEPVRGSEELKAVVI
jgi:hypothetical protein